MNSSFIQIRFLFAFKKKTSQIFLTIGVLITISSAAVAQNYAARPDRGVAAGTYSISDIESISLANGNVNISIPLASLPPMAGGKLSFDIRAVYNSKTWDVVREQKQPDPLDPSTYDISHLQPSINPWTIGGLYTLYFSDSHDDFYWLPPHQGDPEYDLLVNNSFKKAVLTTPDGAQHELRPLDFASYDAGFSHRDYLRGFYKDRPGVNGVNTARYYSLDGSFLWAQIDPFPPGGQPNSWAVYMPDGSIITYNNGIQKIKDPNGNFVRIETTTVGVVSTTHYTDNTTGREIQYEYNSSAPHGVVRYKTVGALANQWTTIDINFDNTFVRGRTYKVNDQLCPDAAELADVSIPVVRSIQFPQTELGKPRRQFSFTYNADNTQENTIAVNYTWRQDCSSTNPPIQTASRGWGSLASMTTPMGAVVKYSYSLDSDVDGTPSEPLTDPDNAARDKLVKKTVEHDGLIGANADIWQYAIANSGQSVCTGSDGSTVTEYSYPHDPALQSMYGGVDGKGGLVYKTVTNSTIVEKHWILKSFGPNGGQPAEATGSTSLIPFNPVVDFEYTTLLASASGNSRMATKVFQYDFNGNVASVTEYSFVDVTPSIPRDPQGVPMGIPPGATPIRTTTSSYYNPADEINSANVYAKRDVITASPRILNALQSSIVGSAQSQFSYDYQTYGTAPSAGLVTTESHWDGAKFLNITHQYDPKGNKTVTTDHLGKKTKWFYEDATLALPTRIEVDPTNQFAGSQHTTLITYDFQTGLVLTHTDANGKQTTTDYLNPLIGINDPLNRVCKVTGPITTVTVGEQTSSQQRTVNTKYEDEMRRVTVESDLNSFNDRKLKTRTQYDQLGRAVLVENSEDGISFGVSSQTVYINTGATQVINTSNPSRGVADATDGWTRSTRDGAGRIIEVATFAGATAPPTTGSNLNCTGTVLTEYSADQTTVTDQANKKRRSVIDGLGRLIQVIEDPGVLGYVTNYGYDVFDDLVSVTQTQQTPTVITQNRYFMYDPLKRLIRARTPEQDTNSAFALSDPVTGNSQWSMKYTYDDSGNLQEKRDSRGVITTYNYDNLNRLTSRTYSNDPQNTVAANYYYDNQTLPPGAPSVSLGSSIGRLIAVTYGGATATAGSYMGYDSLGRANNSVQQTDGQNYAFSYGYDLAGNMTREAYPSGRVVQNDFDSAGRLISVKRQGTDIGYVSGIQYTPSGAIKTMSMGNGRLETTTFNSRLQPTQIRLDSNAPNVSLVKLDYSYGTTNNNGNILSQSISVNGSGGLSIFVGNQNYTYDALNRLSIAEELLNGTSQWKQTYEYDQFGNRAVKTGSYMPTPRQTPTSNGLSSFPTLFDQGRNRVTATADYGYDPDGNLSSMPNKVQGFPADQMAYDAENRQVKFNSPTTQNYFYDGDGRRVKKVIGNDTTVFVYNVAGQLIAEYTSGTPAAGDTSYLTTDHLSSTRLVTDSGGNVKARYDYLPFGEEIGSNIGGRTPSMGYGGNDQTRQKFTQKERDTETGLDYFLARYYSPAQGRFTSPDEFTGGPDDLFTFADDASDNPTFYADLHEPQSLNKYQYAYNCPLRYIDPNGHGVKDWLKRAGETARQTVLGATSAYLQDNGINVDSAGNSVGRFIGHAGAIVQGVTEVVTGVNGVVAGGAEAVVTSPAAATGVGAVVPAAGVVTAVASAGVAAHGTSVLLRTARNVHTQRGRDSEKRVLSDIGEEPNTAKVSSSEGNSVPDYQNRTTVGEIKDTKNVSNTRQIRIQRDAARRSGRTHEIQTGTNTHVSDTVQRGSKIKRRDDLGPQ